MVGDRVPGVLTEWPAPWRAVATLTGVFPVRCVLKGTPQYQYRLCSGPALAGIVGAILISVYALSFLMPDNLVAHKVNSVVLAAIVEIVLTGNMLMSVWLLAARGSRIPGMLALTDEVLSANGKRSISPRSLKRLTCHLLLVSILVVVIGQRIWLLYKTDDVWELDRNRIPYVLNAVLAFLVTVYKMSLLSLSIHLIQALCDAFDAISADLERELTPRSATGNRGPAPPGAADRPPGGRDQPPATTVRVLSVSPAEGDAAVPEPMSAATQADALAALRERYLTAADATAALNSVYMPAAFCFLVFDVGVTVVMWSALTSSSSAGEVLVAVPGAVSMILYASLLCLHGQWLEDAGWRPALLLLRHPPRHPESAAEAARLRRLVKGLRPAAAAGAISINHRLMGSSAIGFVTYLVIMMQMS